MYRNEHELFVEEHFTIKGYMCTNKYYIRETIEGDFNADSKARNDISDILRDLGWQSMALDHVIHQNYIGKSRSLFDKISENITLRIEWGRKLFSMKKNATLVFQFPVIRRPICLAVSLRRVKHRGGRIILLVHDIEAFRFLTSTEVLWIKKKRISHEDRSVLKLADKIIVHNSKMREAMVRLGYEEEKMTELGLFDYLCPAFEETMRRDICERSVAIAGNLMPHKAKYLQQLPADVTFELYGIGYEDQGRENVHYNGALPPDEMPMRMKGSFGLVWDGDSADTCSGVFGEYLKINNPHKTSLYLASGMPVIIWKDAALASFIVDNKVGVCIGSLKELSGVISSISEEEYQEMCENAECIGAKLRAGEFFKAALEKSLKD